VFVAAAIATVAGFNALILSAIATMSRVESQLDALEWEIVETA
jgi:hypothetical protein